jgi:hypothetical protein
MRPQKTSAVTCPFLKHLCTNNVLTEREDGDTLASTQIVAMRTPVAPGPFVSWCHHCARPQARILNSNL